MKKVLFINRDGTLIWEEPTTFQIDSLELLEFLPGVVKNLSLIRDNLDYEIVMLSNQNGLGTDAYKQEHFETVQAKLVKLLKNENIIFNDIIIDKRFAHEVPSGKPLIDMLGKYTSGYDLSNSYVIGDRISDVKIAKELGTKSILIRNYEDPEKAEVKPDLIITQWDEVYEHLRHPPRKASKSRNTKETKIHAEICLDGSGVTEISTGIGFFDHMLEQIARHGELDLVLKVEGDLHVDEHHVIEDVGITLGEVFSEALGDKRGIERYSFVLPMDDTLAQVALDLGGRPWLIWDVEFKREMIGEMPTEMFSHFFKSFSDAAKCNLNISSNTGNEHHKIEGIFKAFAKCLRMAKLRGDSQALPTTKGVL